MNAVWCATAALSYREEHVLKLMWQLVCTVSEVFVNWAAGINKYTQKQVNLNMDSLMLSLNLV